MIEWHGVEQNQPDWSWESRLVACHQFEAGEAASDEHCTSSPMRIGRLTNAPCRRLPRETWRRVIDTSLPSPEDIDLTYFEVDPPIGPFYRGGPRSVVLLRSVRTNSLGFA